MEREPTQPLVLSQTQSEIDPSIHARLISLLPGTVPTGDLKLDSFVVGRDPALCQLVVPDKRVSGQHFRVYLDEFAYYIEALGSAPTWHNGQLVKRGSVRMLSSGDSISLLYNNCGSQNVAVGQRVADFHFQVINARCPSDVSKVESRYQIVKELGAGNFGKVLLGIDKKDARTKVAVKKIDLDKFEKFRQKRGTKLARTTEVNLSLSLKHPNLINFFDIWEGSGELCLVMEFCEGGDLLRNLQEQGAFPELRGRKLVAHLLDAVKYLHDQNIVHRDLKCENVLLTSSSREVMVPKISDFGLAVKTDEHIRDEDFALDENKSTVEKVNKLRAKATVCRTMCGTPSYLAPEIIKVHKADAPAAYGREVDMWAMGVMLYIILSAVPPFDADDEHRILYSHICRGAWAFDVPEFDQVSRESKALVSSLLKVDACARFTADQAAKHEWFRLNIVDEKLVGFKARRLEEASTSASSRGEDAACSPAKRARFASNASVFDLIT